MSGCKKNRKIHWIYFWRHYLGRAVDSFKHFEWINLFFRQTYISKTHDRFSKIGTVKINWSNWCEAGTLCEARSCGGATMTKLCTLFSTPPQFTVRLNRTTHRYHRIILSCQSTTVIIVAVAVVKCHYEMKQFIFFYVFYAICWFSWAFFAII